MIGHLCVNCGSRSGPWTQRGWTPGGVPALICGCGGAVVVVGSMDKAGRVGFRP